MKGRTLPVAVKPEHQIVAAFGLGLEMPTHMRLQAHDIILVMTSLCIGSFFLKRLDSTIFCQSSGTRFVMYMTHTPSMRSRGDWRLTLGLASDMTVGAAKKALAQFLTLWSCSCLVSVALNRPESSYLLLITQDAGPAAVAKESWLTKSMILCDQ